MGLRSLRIATWLHVLPVPFRAYLMSGFLGAVGRNGYLLAAAWILAQGDKSANAVALFLLIASVTELVASPLAGVAADRIDRRRVHQVAEVVRFVTILTTGLALDGAPADAVLYASAVFFSVCDRVSLTAYQALLPASSSPAPIMTASSLAFFIVQLGNLAAALLCGLLLGVCNTPITFVLLAVFPLVAAVIGNAAVTRSVVTERTAFATASRLFPRLDGTLLRLVADYALLYGSGVLVSVMGAAFILHDLKGSAVDFGVMEACWSVGSILGALLPMIAFPVIRQDVAHLVMLQTIAISCLCLWFAGSPVHLLIFMLIGGCFNAGRVGIEAWLHRHLCPAEQGRAKGLLHSAAMMLAILIFIACAKLAQAMSPALVFAAYGAVVMGVSLGLHLVMTKRGNPGRPIGLE